MSVLQQRGLPLLARLRVPSVTQGAVSGSLREYVEENSLVQISDPAIIGAWIDRVLEANPQQLEQFRGGKNKLQGYFVGWVPLGMKSARA